MPRAHCSLSGSVLLLNAHYAALRVISVRRAFVMLFKRALDDTPLAEVVNVEDGRYTTYDFDSWAELSAFRSEFQPDEHDWVRTVRQSIAVPRIIRVLSYTRIPRQQVKFNRRNIFARDGNTCQYCGRRFCTQELSIDHVKPRSRGGSNSWENVATACVKCNVRKGGRTPQQAHMRLIKPPIKPRRSPTIGIRLMDGKYSSWKHFVDAAYWDVELR